MSIPDLGATGIITAVILALGAIGFIKGLIRTILALICLAIGGYAALWGHEHASDLTGPWLTNPGPWMPKVIAVATGLVVFFICRYLLHFVINPFDESKTGKKIGFGIPAAMLSLCAGLAIIWTGFTGIRYAGSLAELRYTKFQVLETEQQEADTQEVPLMMTARRALDASSIGIWQRKTDPFYVPHKLDLCKLLVLYHHGATRAKMLAHPDLNELLNNPAFIQLAYEPTVLEAVQSGNPRSLFTASVIDRFLTDQKDVHKHESLAPEILNASISRNH